MPHSFIHDRCMYNSTKRVSTQTHTHYLMRRRSRSSEMVNLTPFARGNVTIDLLPLPMRKIFDRRVANKFPAASLMCTMMPTRPVLRPPVTITVLPVSYLMTSLILPVLMSMTTVSFTFACDVGRRIVRASCVTRYETAPTPVETFFTLHNLYPASSALIRWQTNLPLTS